MTKQRKEYTEEEKAQFKQNKLDSIAADFIDCLDADRLPWIKPWSITGIGMPTNANTGAVYSGGNFFRLTFKAQSKGFRSNLWLGRKQAREYAKKGPTGKKLLVHPLKGQTGTYIARPMIKELADGKEELRFTYAPIWNVEQYANIDLNKLKVPMPKLETEIEPLSEDQRIEQAQRIFDTYTSKSSIKISEIGSEAYYAPAFDTINMPKWETFKTGFGYYSTAFHESVHSTGHDSRLDRDGVIKHNRFGGKEYSKEELIAEIGASMLSGVCDFKEYVIENQRAYVQGWHKALSTDPEWIIQASSKAFEAVELILKKSGEPSLLDHTRQSKSLN